MSCCWKIFPGQIFPKIVGFFVIALKAFISVKMDRSGTHDLCSLAVLDRTNAPDLVHFTLLRALLMQKRPLFMSKKLPHQHTSPLAYSKKHKKEICQDFLHYLDTS